MHRIGQWFERGRAATDNSSLDAVKEAEKLKEALIAAELIMNDDIPGAEAQLALGDSAFHKLAAGTLSFIKATLGFEQDVMKEAHELLYEAENSAYMFHQKALHDPQQPASTIYDKGSEFALCQAEAQIMSAVVAVLSESLTESIKGFYKMRKAYLALDALAQMEINFIKSRGVQSLRGSRNTSSESIRSVKSAKSGMQKPSTIPAAPSTLRHAATVNDTGHESNDSDRFYDIDNAADSVNKKYQGHLSSAAESPLDEKMQHLTVEGAASSRSINGSPLPSGATTPVVPSGATTPALELPPGTASTLLTVDADSDIFTNPLDIFIHSGVNLMSGLINLMLSVLPPAFGRLLSIIGFRGERERGLRMLWQASKFSNINGGMAALVLFGWYNGMVGFCDIVTDSDPSILDDVNGFPMERLHGLLAQMRVRYPKSMIWRLEEARTFSTTRRLSKALDILSTTDKANMRQLEALHMFEMSVDAMNAHRYELCAKSFLSSVDLNGWSQALYIYTAAAAYLQLYRDAKDGPDQAKAEKYRKLAEQHFKDAPTRVGKKKMMGKQLPFDVFVLRKIAKWEARATAWDCSFVDAIGVAPIEEIVMFWNGYKKMDEVQLNKSLANLAWSNEKSPFWEREEFNERAIQATLSAIAYRNLRQHDQAKAILQQTILPHDPSAFRGLNNDEWPGPVGNYEMAANCWMERKEYIRRYGSTIAGPERDSGQVISDDIKADALLVAQARKYCEKAKFWGSYELDTRIGMKVTTGLGAITKWETKHKDLLA